MYTVKEAAEKLNLSPHAVRHYTDNDLIPSMQRDKNNNRLFDEQSMKWLLGVKNLRGCGMSISAIKNYISLCLKGDETVSDRMDILIKQKEEIDLKIEELNQYSEYLNKKVEVYKKIIDGKIEDPTNPDKW